MTALTFTIGIQYVYSFMTIKFRFLNDIEEMVGTIPRPIKWYFMSMWFVGAPIMIIFIVVNSFIAYAPMADRYEETYGTDSYLIYPQWSEGLGMTMAFASFIPIPIFFFWQITKMGTLAFYPTKEWVARGKPKNSKKKVEPEIVESGSTLATSEENGEGGNSNSAFDNETRTQTPLPQYSDL